MSRITVRHCSLWLPLAAALVAVSACQDHRLGPPDPRPTTVLQQVTPLNFKNKLDVVFMIDNSVSMKEEQDNLIRNFPRFMTVLKEASKDSSLDVHIGVISSDLGSGQRSVVCRPKPNGPSQNGGFQSAPRSSGAACPTPRGAFIISNPQGNNFDGSIEEVFSCIARLGTDGCGFEQQLGSLRRALGGDPDVPMPPENMGFVRPDARLGVVLITDEDDCSAPANTDLFRDSDQLLSSEYGPQQSFRCNEYGHLCNGSPPPRRAGVTLTGCESNETASSKLIHIGDVVTFLKTLKPNPTQLVVASITGPNTPYVTQVGQQRQAGMPDYVEIAPSCQIVGNEGAAPAVRLHQFTNAFGDNGLIRSICVDDFADVMKDIAIHIGKAAPSCIGERLVDADPNQPGRQVECVVVEQPQAATLGTQETIIPACDAIAGKTPCWSLVTDAAQCPSTVAPESLLLKIDRGGAPEPTERWLKTSCLVCLGDSDPRCAKP
jgi:hypothetical protein